MSSFYSPTGNLEIWQEKPDGYFTTEEWAELHPAPTAYISLEELKEAKKTEIAAARYETEIAGVTYNGLLIHTDRESRSLLTGTALKASVDPSYVCRWKTGSGFVSLSSSQIIAVADVVREYVQGCFDREGDLCDLIDAAETKADLENITWT